jgi:hypothetical protein
VQFDWDANEELILIYDFFLVPSEVMWRTESMSEYVGCCEIGLILVGMAASMVVMIYFVGHVLKT